MKKQLLLLLTAILSLSASAQISFEKGYFINNSGEKIDCLIKNIEWRNNPTEFEYQLVQNGTLMNENIKSVKEFGIYNSSKYVRSTVKIDKSPTHINNLSDDKNPVFVEEQLFLKVLVEGKSNLYQYENGNIQRFFYNKDTANIEQLVFKNFKNSEDKTGENNQFRQQLWNDLKCPSITMNKMANLKYQKNSLTNFFAEYNKCNNSEFVNYDRKVKRDLFNLSIRPRLNNSSLFIKDLVSNSTDIDFGSKLGFGIGIEAEYILPYNKNKWAIAIEPTYQNFKSEKAIDGSYFSGGNQIATVNYNYIDIPLSVRHYFFLSSNAKIFINASYIFDVNSKSSIEFTRAPNTYINSAKLITRSNFGFGVGYKFKDKYSLEMRWQTSRNVTGDYFIWNSDYKTFSVIFGYSLF
ncbi:porin family protein [Flavobacterium caseinilyticum]|uniref:PorT family protein n=1 Tax=Flavobacterium caseinilyticum TaxID=2541732 RepID=A0A4R5ASL6_9FLAO|nr:outer membrane beta-barrel protein [Flavobacterium caseinilyticum]TDD75285.1 PorT family protein [Flavobacterium caseinilyticum]